MNSRKIALTFGIIGTLCFGAVLGRAQSSFPVLLGNAPGVSAAAAAATNNGQMPDDLVVIASSPYPGVTEVDIPPTTMATYCGDGDGCRLRLFRSANDGASLAETIILGLFSTSSDGTDWRLYDPSTGASLVGGSASDQSTETILENYGGNRECLLADSAGRTSYDLRAILFLQAVDIVDCVLRIED